MNTGEILSIISIVLTVIFGVIGLIVGGTILKRMNANSKIGDHSSNNIVNLNSNNIEK